MIAVIADDITGAAEIVGVCLRYGLRVSFTLGVVALSEVDVLVIATDTRSIPLQEAEKQIYRLSSELKEAGIKNIFKKADSVLRGYVIGELKAVCEALGKSKVLLVPANTETGRIISGGKYYVNDVPLSNTSFSEDPDFPARFSAVEKILENPVFKLHTGKIEEIKEGVSVPDTTSAKDYKMHAGHCSAEVIPAGSAAFFEAYLVKQLPGIALVQDDKEQHLNGKTLIVCGSTHKNSREFIRKARKRAVAVSEMPQELLQQKAEPEEVRKWSNEVIHLLRKVNKVIVAVRQQTVSFEDSSKIIKETLAEVVYQVLSGSAIKELFVEGGATTFSIVRKTGLKAFIPLNELGKGVVRMKIVGCGESFMSIKPGSYKWPEYLLEEYGL